MGKLGGRKPKDSVISDGFNSTKIYTKPGRPRKRPTPPADLPSESPATQLASSLGITASDIDAWGEEGPSSEHYESIKESTKEITESTEDTEETREKDPPADAISNQPSSPPSGSNTPSAGKADSGVDSGEDLFAEGLMDDMRYVYKQLGGRVKLKELMMQDREFINLVKELMKVEAAYLTKKLGMKGEGQTQGFLVVLKGLEGDDKLVKDLVANKTIDFKQIERAMNPTLDRTKIEEEIHLGLRPEEIMRKVSEVKE